MSISDKNRKRLWGGHEVT